MSSPDTRVNSSPDLTPNGVNNFGLAAIGLISFLAGSLVNNEAASRCAEMNRVSSIYGMRLIAQSGDDNAHLSVGELIGIDPEEVLRFEDIPFAPDSCDSLEAGNIFQAVPIILGVDFSRQEFPDISQK